MAYEDAITVKQLMSMLAGCPKTARVYFDVPGTETIPVSTIETLMSGEPVMVLLQMPDAEETDIPYLDLLRSELVAAADRQNQSRGVKHLKLTVFRPGVPRLVRPACNAPRAHDDVTDEVDAVTCPACKTTEAYERAVNA